MLDLGAVLGAFEVAELRFERIDGAVEAVDLGVEEVDEAPKQRFAFVGELCAVAGDVGGECVEGGIDGVHGVVLVPQVAVVGLVGAWRCAEELGLLAGDGGGGAVLCVVHGRSP